MSNASTLTSSSCHVTLSARPADFESDLRTHIGSTAEAVGATRVHDQSIDQRGTAARDHHLEVDAMYTHRITTSRRSLLEAPMIRPAGDYDAETLEALRAFLADLAWSDQGE